MQQGSRLVGQTLRAFLSQLLTAICVLGLTLTMSCAHSDSDEAEDRLTMAPQGRTFGQDGHYLIEADDLIDIYVHNKPEYSGRYRVGNNGLITLPRVGVVQASGRSIQLLRTALAIKLRPFVKYPRVYCSVAERNSYQVVFSGSIRKPGVYKLGKKTTLIEGIAMAGGLTSDGEANVILIRSDKQGIKRRYLAPVTELLAGSPSLDNFILERGDIVLVQ